MKKIILKLILFYQRGGRATVCRFKPTCSEYSYQAIEKYGIIKGSLLGLRRIFKCHPWSQGRYDPVS